MTNETPENFDFEEILDLSLRSRNALRNGGIMTLDQLLKCSADYLKNSVRACGFKCIREIRQKLAQKDYNLQGECYIGHKEAIGILENIQPIVKELRQRSDTILEKVRDIENAINRLMR